GCRPAACRYRGNSWPWRGLYRPGAGGAPPSAWLQARERRDHIDVEARDWSRAPPALIAPVGGVADGSRNAVVAVDDDHAVAHLHVAVVALGDGDGRAVVLLHGHLDAAPGRVLVDRGAGNGAADRAEDATEDRTAGRAADRGTGNRAARSTDAAADQRAIIHARAAVAQRHFADGDDPPGLAAI